MFLILTSTEHCLSNNIYYPETLFTMLMLQPQVQSQAPKKP